MYLYDPVGSRDHVDMCIMVIGCLLRKIFSKTNPPPFVIQIGGGFSSYLPITQDMNQRENRRKGCKNLANEQV